MAAIAIIASHRHLIAIASPSRAAMRCDAIDAIDIAIASAIAIDADAASAADAAAAAACRRCAATFLVIETKGESRTYPFFFDVDWPEPQYGVFGHPALRRLRRAAPPRVDVRKRQTDRQTDGHDK
jgi:hypothetical protein